MSAQPEDLRLADALEHWTKDYATTDFDCEMGEQAAAELRRLHAVNQELLEALRLLIDGIDAVGKRNKTVFSGFSIDQARAAIAKATGGAA